MVPGLEDRLMKSSEEEVMFVGELVCSYHVLGTNLTELSDTERRIERTL